MNRLPLKSGDNAESHLPGLREGAGWLGQGKLGGKPGLIVFRSSETLPNPWPKESLQESAWRQRAGSI